MARRQFPRTPQQRSRLIRVLAALALVVGLAPLTSPAARAATLSGHDISWPQCPVADGGYGLPMPPTSTRFVVVGLTKGLPFTRNPCLASQVKWVSSHAKPAQAYTMAAFPTAAQLATYRTRGPWSASTRAGQLSNVGYAEATYAVAELKRVGFAPPVVWVDVEPRPAQPWPTGTATRQRENRYVVEGLMRGLRDARFSYGVYSYTSGWQSITGSWWLPGVPVWATAGRLDYPGEAQDRCRQASFSGGRVQMAQWYDDTRDYDLTCDPWTFGALPVPASTLSGATADFNGDWKNDVLARVAATAELRLYAGTGRGTLPTRVRVGAGWRGMDALETPGDLNGDGRLDVLARERATGYLWLYPGNGKGGWLPRRQVGNGWDVFSAIVGPGDVNGDGAADVLARQASNGYLWLYPGNGRGAWLPRVRVGTGWNRMTALMSPGDLTGDRTPDLLARDGSGRLWLYPRSGTTAWLPRVQVGAGWNTIDALF